MGRNLTSRFLYVLYHSFIISSTNSAARIMTGTVTVSYSPERMARACVIRTTARYSPNSSASASTRPIWSAPRL